MLHYNTLFLQMTNRNVFFSSNSSMASNIFYAQQTMFLMQPSIAFRLCKKPCLLALECHPLHNCIYMHVTFVQVSFPETLSLRFDLQYLALDLHQKEQASCTQFAKASEHTNSLQPSTSSSSLQARDHQQTHIHTFTHHQDNKLKQRIVSLA